MDSHGWSHWTQRCSPFLLLLLDFILPLDHQGDPPLFFFSPFLVRTKNETFCHCSGSSRAQGKSEELVSINSVTFVRPSADFYFHISARHISILLGMQQPPSTVCVAQAAFHLKTCRLQCHATVFLERLWLTFLFVAKQLLSSPTTGRVYRAT